MRSRVLLVIVSAVAAVFGCGPSKSTPGAVQTPTGSVTETKDDLASVAGEWKVTKIEMIDGRPPAEDEIAAISLAITGDKGRIGFPGDMANFRIRTDSKASPKTLVVELTNERGETEFKTQSSVKTPRGSPEPPAYTRKMPKYTGIYKLEGDTLVIAMAEAPSPRPTEFVATKPTDKPGNFESPMRDAVVVVHFARGKATPPRNRPGDTMPTSNIRPTSK